MITLLESDIIDPETEAHFAFHKTISNITFKHDHDFYELFLVTEGRVYHVINGKRELISEGALVFIRPDDVHYYEKYGTNDCKLINLAFPKASLKALTTYLGEGFSINKLLKTHSPPARILSGIETKQMIVRFQKLAMIPNQFKREVKSELRAILAEIFINFFTERQRKVQHFMPEWLEKVSREMKKKENFTIGLPQLQKLSARSPEYLCRVIKQYYNKTPTQWINDIRLHYASNLLIYTDEDILNICHDSGFGNLSHFYHLFRKKFNITPSKFRQLNRKSAIPE